jgi:hypothetical protein
LTRPSFSFRYEERKGGWLNRNPMRKEGKAGIDVFFAEDRYFSRSEVRRDTGPGCMSRKERPWQGKKLMKRHG